MAPQYPAQRRQDLELRPLSLETGSAVVARVSTEYQAEYHPVAPVNSSVFGSRFVDPGFITMQINYSMLGGMFRPPDQESDGARGGIHVSEDLTLHRGVELGEEIVIQPVGSPELTPHRLGTMSRTRFVGRDTAGQVVWELVRVGIIGINMGEPSRPAPTAPRKARRDERDGRVFVCSKQFSPEIVLGYCNDFIGLNPIHHDPEVAAEAGFRQPIWAGAQGIHICLEHLCGLVGGMPSQLEMSAKLHRAVCWDETIELWYEQQQGKPPGVGRYFLLRVADEYKPALEMHVRGYTRGVIASRM